MANDRLYLRCKKCMCTRLFWKYYPTDGGSMPITKKEISKWMADHLLFCTGTMFLGDDSPIELIT